MAGSTRGRRGRSQRNPYRRLRGIDGRHPFKRAVPGAYIDYRARRRHDSEIAYFNFDLAREMGLIPARHPDRLTRALRRSVLDAFSLVIINEYDYLNRTPIPAADLLPHGYMATRYLQLQHPGRLGETSGDGRSIWNGCVSHAGHSWDVSSCGTGVTRLCPATAEHQTFFKTGNWIASYGCGTAALAEGINSAVMSEVFHRNGIATERVLAVLKLPSGLAINVRAASCLLRPSHFFVHLAQGNLASLRDSIDFYIARQIGNGRWPGLPDGNAPRDAERRYCHFAEDTARSFARVAAIFESEYVFCWLEWDGDNVLADGSIIDYGSVRQFGLYHREYRFDDVGRMSTTIPEQRRKARHIVQKYAQIRDYLIRGEKTPLERFAADPILELFDREFERVMRDRLLAKIGFEPSQREALLARCAQPFAGFERAFRSFERARSSRGPTRVPDGLSWNAVYCMRDLLRQLPARYVERCGEEGEPAKLEDLFVSPRELVAISLSSYASRKDSALTPHRRRMARALQARYLELVAFSAAESGRTLRTELARLARRAEVLNHYGRITGDSVDWASTRLIRRLAALGPAGVFRVIQAFTDYQDLDPERAEARAAEPAPPLADPEARALRSMIRVTRELRESL